MSTKNAEAQRAFDEGLARMYGFNHDAAAKAFKHARTVDPKLAMAYWGEALAIGPNYNLPEIDAAAAKAAYDASQRAMQLSSSATPAERDYIATLTKRYSNDPKADVKKLLADYADAMRELAKKYPNDLDAQTLWAESMMNLRPWKLWSRDGVPAEGTEKIVATLENVLKRNPNHIGANHYYIHAVEASKSPERAMASAQRLPTLAPNQGHLVHMPAHIYMRTGDYAAAITANQQAVKVDDKFIACCGPKPDSIYPAFYYNHNVHFLMAAACMANQSKLAIDSSRTLAKNLAPMAKEVVLAEPYCAMPYIVLVRFGKWDEILAEPAPDAAMPSVVAANHFARAMAFAAKGDLIKARTEQGAFEAARAKMPSTLINNNNIVEVMAVASHLLAGRVALAAGDQKAGIASYRSAVEAQDRLEYDEPAPWPWPVREQLGAALLAAGDAKGAQDAFTQDLAKNPKNPRSLLGLSESLNAQGKREQADAARKAFRQVAEHAD
ncbi:MAG: hypothetical protein H7Z14_03925, partial [Anaerolineae bacterium]|nr:hypothetical protein [Phycisphaerae bacterium]